MSKQIYTIVDFESKSLADLTSIGAWNYSLHASTTILCMSYKIDDAETKIWVPGQKEPEDLLEAIASGSLIEAFNSFFEYVMWNHVLAKQFNFPKLPLERFMCTQARASQFAFPRSLEQTAEALGLDIQKDMEGHRIMLQMCKPRKPLKAEKDKNPNWRDTIYWHDDEDKFKKLCAYCMKDVETTYAVRKKLLQFATHKQKLLSRYTKFKQNELALFRLNNIINERGIYFDRELAIKSLKIVDTHQEEMNKQLSELTKGEITSTGQIKKMTEYIHSQGFKIPSLGTDVIDVWLPEVNEHVKQILEIRKASSKSSIKKIKSMLDRASDDDRIRGVLVYHGAGRTGRFSSIGIQVQNFIRPILSDKEIDECIDDIKSNISYIDFVKKYKDVLGAISSCLRGMLCAPKGHKFYDSDFAAIEARVLFWLAEEEVGLEAYRQGKDIYKQMASVIYDKPIHKITKDNRQLGKQSILGCGYSMSAKKFALTCQSHNMNVSEDLAKKAVDSYRSLYTNVVDFWRKVEKAALQAVYNGYTPYKVGGITFYRIEEMLYIILPSGRVLSYHKPRLEKTPWGKPKLMYKGFSSQIRKYEDQETYGGKICENIVQSVARDFMAEAMIRAEKANYNLIFTVHDQLVAETKEDFGSVAEFNDIMEEMPDWGANCPINAESMECKRFKK